MKVRTFIYFEYPFTFNYIYKYRINYYPNGNRGVGEDRNHEVRHVLSVLISITYHLMWRSLPYNMHRGLEK